MAKQVQPAVRKSDMQSQPSDPPASRHGAAFQRWLQANRAPTRFRLGAVSRHYACPTQVPRCARSGRGPIVASMMAVKLCTDRRKRDLLDIAASSSVALGLGTVDETTRNPDAFRRRCDMDCRRGGAAGTKSSPDRLFIHPIRVGRFASSRQFPTSSPRPGIRGRKEHRYRGSICGGKI